MKYPTCADQNILLNKRVRLFGENLNTSAVDIQVLSGQSRILVPVGMQYCGS